MISKNDLRMIDAETFYEGMYIGSDVYLEYKNRYLLLCHGVLMTELLIEKLRRASRAGQNIYVLKEYYDELIQQHSHFEQLTQEEPEPEKPEPVDEQRESQEELSDLQRKLRMVDDYRELTDVATQLVQGARDSGQVSLPDSEKITALVREKLHQSDGAIIIQCIDSLRNVEDYLYTHSVNVSMLNGLMGGWMGFGQEDVQRLIRIGLLHDIGKTRIPPEILNKPARLSPEEFRVVQKHPVYSYEMALASGESDPLVLAAIRGHHERMNGTGYPDGLQGEQIGIFARITAISDVYDAMVAKRPYKDRFSPFDILAEFAESRFSSLDLRLVDIFLHNLPLMLMGKRVLLTDGRVGKVAYINPNKFAYPIVKVGGKFVETNPSLKCVGLDNFISILPD